jgi:hypothetical protein
MGYQSIAPDSSCKANPRYHEFGFCLSGIQNDLHMVAETEDDMKEWLGAINLQIEQAQSKSQVVAETPTLPKNDGEKIMFCNVIGSRTTE